MSLFVDHLSVFKAGKSILDDILFAAPAGRITGLIGPNGAGKSTLLAAILGITESTGEVGFEATDLRALPRRDRARLLAFVEQSASTEERLSVRDVVALGRIPFQPSWAADLSPEDDRIIDTALADLGMGAFAQRRFMTLSGGEQQRVHVARALAQQPHLLLLDEPTSHLDIRAQLDLMALLRRKAEAGMTVLLAIHDLNLAARFCDHLVLLGGGRKMAEGPPAGVLTTALLETAYHVHARRLPDPETGTTHIVLDLPVLHNPD